MIDRALLSELLHDAPHQPATQLFRAVELGHLLQSGALPLDGHLLDLGCGDGRILQLLRRKLAGTWKCVGIDPNSEEVELAKSTGLYERLHVTGGDAVPEPDASFDIVFSNSVVEHIPQLEPVLREVARLLRSGGRFVLTTPAHGFHAALSGPGLLGRVATGEKDRTKYLTALDHRVAHLRYWNEQQWREQLASAGLELATVSWYLTPAELQRWELLTNLTSGVLTRIRGRGKTPLDIQRELGVRRTGAPLWVRILGLGLGQLFSLGIRSNEGSPPDPECSGGVLIAATKSG